MIRGKRIYDPPSREDGFRVLVDRLWPRGLSKTRAKVDLWLKEIAPSDGLRKWFGHDSTKWEAFKGRYRKELKATPNLIRKIRALEREHGTITLLYAAADELRNNALALSEFLKGTRNIRLSGV